MPKHFKYFTNTSNFETVETRPRINAILVLVLKVCREFDDVTSAGKLFHVRAAATGSARSPTVDSGHWTAILHLI